MRKIIIIVFFSILTFQFSYIFSQSVEKKMKLKNEFSFSYGFGSTQELASVMADFIISIFTFTNVDGKEKSGGGPYMLQYKRVLWDHLGIGVLFSYTSYNAEFRKASNNTLLYTRSNQFYAAMYKLDYYYVLNEWVQMYSGGSFGIMDYKTNTTTPDNPVPKGDDGMMIAFQINLFSMRVGKTIGGYFELGVGANGLVNLGVSYKF